MNKKKLSVLFTIGILLTVAVVASIDMSQTADAVKSKGVKTQKYGQATKDKVCGDKLCSESTSKSSESRMDKDHMKSMDKDEMKSMGKMDMDKMKKQHMDMISKMKTMNKQEMIETMKQMMTEQMNMMAEKMGEMDRQEIIDHMNMMVDKMGDMKHGDKKHGDMKQMYKKEMAPLYNEALNPSQIEYQNIVGFNDLHIEAIRHLEPNGDNSKLGLIVHHHCKVYDDMTAACLLFPTGMNDQDKPYGIEYIITSEQFQELSDDEKKSWHYHLTELPRAQANFPDLTDEQLMPLRPVLDETYGKVFYFWDTDDKYPIGEPSVLVIQNLPE